MRNYEKIRTVATDWRQGTRPGKRSEAQYDYSTADYFERYQPARGASRESDVLVPFLQAAITGAFTAVMLGIIAGVLVYYKGEMWGVPWWAALVVVAMTWLLTTSGVWLRLLNDSRELLWKVEAWSNRDLDGDGTTGKPQEPAQVVRLEIEANNNGQRSSFFHDLPTEPAVFTTWAQAAVNGQSLAVGHWTGSGRPFSRYDYEALLDFLQGAGVVAWQNPDAPAQGRKLTKPGRAALTAWLEGVA